jgi:hypothetical protein
MRSRFTARAAALVALAACACSSSDGGSGSNTCSASTSFPTSPFASLASAGGKLRIDVRTAPYQPLQAGLDCIQLVVTDATTGAPVDGLTVGMTPWMPAMDHGSSVTPQPSPPLGQGRYVFTNVSLPMPGEWELRTQFSGAVTDSVDPTFNIN